MQLFAQNLAHPMRHSGSTKAAAHPATRHLFQHAFRCSARPGAIGPPADAGRTHPSNALFGSCGVHGVLIKPSSAMASQPTRTPRHRRGPPHGRHRKEKKEKRGAGPRKGKGNHTKKGQTRKTPKLINAFCWHRTRGFVLAVFLQYRSDTSFQKLTRSNSVCLSIYSP